MESFPNIAFFDSGQGGMTVWESVRQAIPSLNTIYLGDNARAPFGNKGAQTITQYTSEAVLFLSKMQTQFVVVACGTASSVAVERLKNIYQVPIVGIVESFLSSISQVCTPQGRVAILGTRFTIQKGAVSQALKEAGYQNQWHKACPLWVPLVEEGFNNGPIAQALVEFYLEDIPADTKAVALACTHFPRLVDCISNVLQKKFSRPVIHFKDQNSVNHLSDGNGPIFLVDSSFGMTRIVNEFISKHPNPKELLHHQTQIFCTDATEKFAQVGSYFTQSNLSQVKRIELRDVFY
jgi:glutamate racemase